MSICAVRQITLMAPANLQNHQVYITYVFYIKYTCIKERNNRREKTHKDEETNDRTEGWFLNFEKDRKEDQEKRLQLQQLEAKWKAPRKERSHPGQVPLIKAKELEVEK